MSQRVSERDLSKLPELAAVLGISLQQEHCQRLAAYLVRIYLWNRSAGLTTVVPADAMRLHLLDSLTVLPLLAGARHLADLGTGAGLPGLVLSIVGEFPRIDLVETARKKVSFLREAVRELGVSDRVRVLQKDAATLEDRYDAVVARAFRHPDEYLECACGIAMPGARVVLMGARLSDSDVQSLREEFAGRLELADDHALRLPGGPEQRRLLLWKTLN